MTHNLTRIFVATALAAALATPAMSQSRQSSDPYQAYAQQSSKVKKAAKKTARKKQPPQRYTARQHTAAKPCAAWSWAGCLGWDPDPNVRSTIRMDANLYDD